MRLLVVISTILAALQASAHDGPHGTELYLSFAAALTSANVNRPFNITGKVENGVSAVSGAVFNLIIPQGVTVIRSLPPGDFSNNILTWQLGSLPPAFLVNWTVEVTATKPGPVTFIGRTSTTSPVLSEIKTKAIPIIGPPSISLAFNDGPSSATPNTDYTISGRVTNGPVAASRVVFQLVLPASTSLVSSFPPGDVSLPNVTWALNTLDPDALIPFTVTLRSASAGRSTVQGTVTSTTASLQATASTSVNVGTPTISLSFDSEPQTAKGGVQYNISGRFAVGPVALQTVTYTLAIPTGTRYVSSSPAGTLSGSNLVWNLPSLSAGAIVPFTVTVETANAGTTNFQGTIGSASPRTEASAAKSVVVSPPDLPLSVRVQASPSEVRHGKESVISILVENRNAYPVKNARLQIKAMNDGIKLHKANPKASSENSDKTRLTWTDISLGPGDKLEAVVTAKLDKGRGRKNLKASTSYQLDNRTLESEDTVSIRVR